jgi:hypothetical protein
VIHIYAIDRYPAVIYLVQLLSNHGFKVKLHIGEEECVGKTVKPRQVLITKDGLKEEWDLIQFLRMVSRLDPILFGETTDK